MSSTVLSDDWSFPYERYRREILPQLQSHLWIEGVTAIVWSYTASLGFYCYRKECTLLPCGQRSHQKIFAVAFRGSDVMQLPQPNVRWTLWRMDFDVQSRQTTWTRLELSPSLSPVNDSLMTMDFWTPNDQRYSPDTSLAIHTWTDDFLFTCPGCWSCDVRPSPCCFTMCDQCHASGNVTPRGSWSSCPEDCRQQRGLLRPALLDLTKQSVPIIRQEYGRLGSNDTRRLSRQYSDLSARPLVKIIEHH